MTQRPQPPTVSSVQTTFQVNSCKTYFTITPFISAWLFRAAILPVHCHPRLLSNMVAAPHTGPCRRKAGLVSSPPAPKLTGWVAFSHVIQTPKPSHGGVKLLNPIPHLAPSPA
eukprot:1188109-Prorocentrum_minimum.AAC.2